MLVSVAFPFVFHISVFFHSLFSWHWISFVFLLYGRRIATHSVDPSLTHLLGEFPGLGLALVPDVVVPEVEQRCAWSRNLNPNFCPGRGLNLGPCSLMAVNVTTRQQRTQPPFSRLLRHPGGYSGIMFTPNPHSSSSSLTKGPMPVGARCRSRYSTPFLFLQSSVV